MVNQAEHAHNTASAKGPTATRGTRSGYDPAAGDFFVMILTSRHSLSEGVIRLRDYAGLSNLSTGVDLRDRWKIGIVRRPA